MFKDEIKKKLKIDDTAVSFTVTFLGRNNAVVCGVKNVLTTTNDRIRLRLSDGVMAFEGTALCVVEIGGGDVYIKGEIGGASFE